MEDLISVIIPVYNVELYIEKCVESIKNQSYSKLEIILVDDGSTDKSGELCDYYALKDNRIKVIHKKNGGLSEARNVGIDIAKGNYISFVDSDDYVSSDYIDNLYRLILKYEADISVCKSIKFNEGENPITQKQQGNEEKLYDNLSAMQDLFYQKHIENNAWGKLYKTELFQEIRFPVGKLYEDLGTIYKILYGARKIIWSSCSNYFYLQRSNSIMNRKFSEKNMDRIYLSEEILYFIQQNVPSLEKAAVSRLFISNIQVLREMPLKDKKYLRQSKSIHKNIKRYRKVVLFDHNAKIINRIIALFSYLPGNTIKIFGGMYKRIYR